MIIFRTTYFGRWEEFLDFVQFAFVVHCHEVNADGSSVTNVRSRLGGICEYDSGGVDADIQNLVDFIL